MGSVKKQCKCSIPNRETFISLSFSHLDLMKKEENKNKKYCFIVFNLFPLFALKIKTVCVRVRPCLTSVRICPQSLLHKISEHRLEGRSGDDNSNASSSSFGGAQINRVIQTLAHKYCVDSKTHFEDLSKIIQKVLACRWDAGNFVCLFSSKSVCIWYSVYAHTCIR